jgi:hypothetical protein
LLEADTVEVVNKHNAWMMPMGGGARTDIDGGAAGIGGRGLRQHPNDLFGC